MTELILKCPHVVTITAEEHDRLELLDDAEHEVEWDLCCDLQGNHPGPHITLGQAAGNDEWWVRWSGTVRELVKLSGCAARSCTSRSAAVATVWRSKCGESPLGAGR